MKSRIIYKTSVLLAAFLVLIIGSHAQDMTVRGKLIDSASSKPIADATINFLQPQKKISTTIVSDKNGTFQTILAQGSYKITITHGTYRKKSMPLAVQAQPVDMGNIQLVTMVKSLAEVSVVASRPLVEQKDDRLIYNVEEDPAAKSESASDLLRKTPYVNVDGEGNVQMNGQSNFKVLLDGRETALFSQNVKDALKAFPGSSIARIEVITSPSAKYDAEGVGGIINIITKKKVTGYNGTINSNINSTGHRSAGFNINLKKGKVGVTGMYHFMNNQGLGSSQLAITTPAQPIAFSRREVGGSRETDLSFHQGNIELSFDLDSSNTLVAYGNLGRHRNQQVNNYAINTFFPNGTYDTDPYQLESEFAMPTHGFGTDFIRKYKGKPQKELTVRFHGLFNTNRSISNSFQDMDATDRFILNNSESFNREYTVQADLVQPLNKSTRLETGIKTILRHAFSDFESQVKNNKLDPYYVDPNNSNLFSYDQNVYSAYMSLNKVTKAVTVRIGVRMEHTYVHGDFTTTNTEVNQRYTNFLPNLLLTKQFSKTMNSNFTYTMRLGRPSIGALNPFVNNSDSLYITYGNPDLGPQYIHSFNWQVRFFKGSKFLSIQTGYNFSNTLIIENPSFDPAEGVTSVTRANAGQIRELVLGLSSNLPVKKWNFSLNATGRMARMRNKLQTDWSTYYPGNVNANITYKISPIFTLTANGGYFVPVRMPNSTFPDNYFYGFNFISKVFKQKLTITANATNFLTENRELNFKTENAYVTTQNRHTVLFRNIGISLAYNFGRLKENVSKKKGVTNDDQVQ